MGYVFDSKVPYRTVYSLITLVLTCYFYPGQRCYITGWGRLSSGGSTPNTLQEAQVPIVTAQKCRESYGSGITDRMLCAGYSQGGIDTCQGDSGGEIIE